MTIYIGAEAAYTPLGISILQNFERLKQGASALQHKEVYGHRLPVSAFEKEQFRLPFEEMIMQAIEQCVAQIDQRILQSERTLLLLSSTKGEIELSVTRPFESVVRHLVGRYLLKHEPIVVSSACISGVAATNLGSRYIQSGYYDHIVVVGCDVLSAFVVNGFQSLFAVRSSLCAPFDQNRAGVNLGEGAAAFVLSAVDSIYNSVPLELLEGAISNDANHISGPSRTGEGLYRAVQKTMNKHGISKEDIGFISAHGTGTLYNDEMEAIAFGRLGLDAIPINSFKGYVGHTLGAAGVVEIAYTMQSLREQILIQCKGFEQLGTSVPLNIITQTRAADLHIALKTASGFGGCNAALIIKNL